MREIFDQSVAAIIGGVIAGLFAVVTLLWGFSHERELKREEQSAKRKGASRAVMVEMAENFTMLKLLFDLASNDVPVGNMRPHLKMRRRALDEYLPLLAGDMSLNDVRDIIAAYTGQVSRARAYGPLVILAKSLMSPHRQLPTTIFL